MLTIYFLGLKSLLLNVSTIPTSTQSFSTKESGQFLTSTLPCIIQLVLDLPALDIKLPCKLVSPEYLEQSKCIPGLKGIPSYTWTK